MELFQRQIFRGLIEQQIRFAQMNTPQKTNSGEVSKTIDLPDIAENVEIISKNNSDG